MNAIDLALAVAGISHLVMHIFLPITHSALPSVTVTRDIRSPATVLFVRGAVECS